MLKAIKSVEMQLVNKHTRAGKNGKNIRCSKCKHIDTVYHFASFDLTVDYLSSEDLSGTKDIIAQIKHSLKSNPS